MSDLIFKRALNQTFLVDIKKPAATGWLLSFKEVRGLSDNQSHILKLEQHLMGAIVHINILGLDA